MPKVKMKCGTTTLVDPGDLELAEAFPWRATKITNAYYAACTIRRKTVYLHRLIARPARGLEVDHVNQNGLDNRRENLRCVSRSRNNSNQIRKNAHGLPGVRTNGSHHFCTSIRIEKKTTYIGTFRTVKETAEAYRKAYLAAFGEEHPFYRR